MRRTLLAFLGLLAACSRPSAAGDVPAPVRIAAVRDDVLATSRAYETVQSMTDASGPRLSGSPGNDAAVAWGKRALEAAGLANVHTEPVKVPHWERGEEHGAIVSPVAQPVALTALGGSVGTKPEGIEAEVVEIASLDALDHADRAHVAGKIVFLDGHMDRTSDGSGYGRAVWPRSKGAIGAAKLGAVGVVIRSVGTDGSRAPHTGAMKYDDAVPKIPAAALSVSDAEVLHRLLAAGKPVRFRMVLGAQTLPDADGANVVGDVPGSGAHPEIVLLGAHLDAWDLGRGALDDAAGCAIVIEAARHIATLARRPRRTVRVVLYANEENGLRGAKAYAKAHEAELAQHAVAIEADLGDGRVRSAAFLGPAEARPLFRAVEAAAEPLGAVLSDAEGHGGADLIPLVEAGVPIIDLRQDATRYFDYHHTAEDTLDHVRKADLDAAAAAFAAVAYAAADAPGEFGRVPEEKRHRE